MGVQLQRGAAGASFSRRDVDVADEPASAGAAMIAAPTTTRRESAADKAAEDEAKLEAWHVRAGRVQRRKAAYRYIQQNCKRKRREDGTVGGVYTLLQ